MRRFRRLRAGEQIRSLVRETRIDKGDLIYPIFIAEGENINRVSCIQIEKITHCGFCEVDLQENRNNKLREVW